MPPLDDSGGRIADDAACLHCGAASPAGARFCCTGCEGAYEAVKGLGLEAFYARRTAPSARPEADGVIHDYATRVNVALECVCARTPRGLLVDEW